MCWQVWESKRLLAFNDPVPRSTGRDNVMWSNPRAGRVFNSTRETERMRLKEEVRSSFWKYDARLGVWRTLKGATPYKTGQQDPTQHNRSVPGSEENHKVKEWREGRAAEKDYNLTQTRRQTETEQRNGIIRRWKSSVDSADKELVENQHLSSSVEQMHDDNLVLQLKRRIPTQRPPCHPIWHHPHDQTFSTSQSGAHGTAFLTPPKIIKPHQGRERPHPRMCKRWAPSGYHFLADAVIPYSQHALPICPIYIWLQEPLGSKGPLEQSDWAKCVCGDFHTLKEKHGPPTSSLFQGLTRLGKQVIQGNHMHMEACSRAHRLGYNHMHSYACATPTCRCLGADSCPPRCAWHRVSARRLAFCFNCQHEHHLTATVQTVIFILNPLHHSCKNVYSVSIWEMINQSQYQDQDRTFIAGRKLNLFQEK